MTVHEFNRFYASIKADVNGDMECAGYLWLRLTEKQIVKTFNYYKSLGLVSDFETNPGWYKVGRHGAWLVKKSLVD